MSQTTKIFVGSLPQGCKAEELRRLFTNYGIVVECDIMNRCGFVHMETLAMADTAITALNGSEFKGQQIVVEPGRPKDRKGNAIGPPRLEGSLNRNGSRGSMQNNPGRGLGGNSNRVNYTQNRGGEGPSSSGSNFDVFGKNEGSGPIRNMGMNKQMRNSPYNSVRNSVGGIMDRSSRGFRKNATMVGNQFHSGPPHNNQSGGGGGFINTSGGRYSGNNSNQYQKWDNAGNAVTNENRNLQRSNFRSGFNGNMDSGSGFQSGGNNQSGQFLNHRGPPQQQIQHQHQQQQQQLQQPGNNQRVPLYNQRRPPPNQRGPPLNQRGTPNNQRGTSGHSRGPPSNQRIPANSQRGPMVNNQRGPANMNNQRGPGNIGQDRRGFALPAVDQQQNQLQFGPQQSRFGNAINGHDDNGRFQRGNNQSSNIAGGRGGFSSSRGGFNSHGRGGFNSHGRGGFNRENSMAENQNNSRNPLEAYQREFPPLGNVRGRGGMNRNGSRQNTMTNRRF